ncbi:hypothetical protein Trydic_g14409 [Trypoxylus dichotomus]
MTPLVKSSTRPKWQRIPKRNVFYYRSPVHQNNYVLSFTFGFDREDEIFQFALAPPYSYSRLQSFLLSLDNKGKHSKCFLKREVIGSSVQKRKLDLITVGAPENMNEKQRVIVILARVHPGESPSSFVCQGLLEFLISVNSLSSLLRQTVTFKIIPMLNPDGVFLGNYRSSGMGFDLNRVWHIASQWVHPTLRAVLDIIIAIDKSKMVNIAVDKNKDFQLDYVVDIHSHSSLTGCFIYGNTYEDVYRYERHTVFPKILATVSDDYVANNTMFNADINKIGTARRYLCTILSNQVNCYTFEVSLFGYQLSGNQVVIPYTEDSYMRCGRNLLRAFLEYYKAIGIIPEELPGLVSKKKKRSKRHTSRSTTRNSCRRLNTTRTPASIHFTDLNINYDSEFSADELPYSSRYNRSPTRISDKISVQDKYVKKIGGGGVVAKSSAVGCSPPTTYIVMPEPSLSIIDFNIMTRQDLEDACKKNKHII